MSQITRLVGGKDNPQPNKTGTLDDFISLDDAKAYLDFEKAEIVAMAAYKKGDSGQTIYKIGGALVHLYLKKGRLTNIAVIGDRSYTTSQLERILPNGKKGSSLHKTPKPNIRQGAPLNPNNAKYLLVVDPNNVSKKSPSFASEEAFYEIFNSNGFNEFPGYNGSFKIKNKGDLATAIETIKHHQEHINKNLNSKTS